MATAEVRETLIKAAELIERDGWTRRALEYGKRHCALGAIFRIAGFDWMSETAIPAVVLETEKHLASYIRSTGRHDLSIDGWNDAQTRRAPVVRGLRAAAEWEPS